MTRVSFESCCDAVVALSIPTTSTMDDCSSRTSTVTVLREHCFNLVPIPNNHDYEIFIHLIIIFFLVNEQTYEHLWHLLLL